MSFSLSPLASPLGAIWALMVFGLAWLLWQRRWRTAIWLGVPTALIFLVGNTPLARQLVAGAERPEAADSSGEASPADVVVALGGAYYPSKYDLTRFSIFAAGNRLLTAVELARRGKAKELVLGGSVPVPERRELVTTGLIQDWLVTSSLVTVPVMNLGLCANTHDEAVRFKQLCAQKGWKTVILVTSALHMRRSVATFKGQGVSVTPVACDFQAYGVSTTEAAWSLLPREERFRILGLYLHEKVGWWVYRARGWI